jgi:hypothetical protein
MTRFRAIYDSVGKLAEYEDGILTWSRQKVGKEKKRSHQIINDIKPYKSMVDGSMITSRSAHREHLRKHNCFEVGNETMKNSSSAVVNSRRETLSRRLGDMSDSQANKILKQLRGN